MLDTQVVDYDGNTLKLKDGSEIPTKTVIWAAGVKAVPFIANCGSEVDRAGRIVVNENCRLKEAIRYLRSVTARISARNGAPSANCRARRHAAGKDGL